MFLDHRAAFRHRLAERFPGFSECGRVTHRKHFAADGTQPTQHDEGGGGGIGARGRAARAGGEEEGLPGVAGFRRNSKPAEDIVPNVWTCVPARSRLLLPFSMHVCPLKMLF